jgi:hypothetical protein
LKAEGFSCSLCFLYGGLGITKLQFFIKKISSFFSAVNYFQFLIIKTLDSELDSDPDTQLRKMLDPESTKSMRIHNPGLRTGRRHRVLTSTSDFDAQMSGIKFLKGDENLRTVSRKPFYGITSGCLRLEIL